MVIIKKVFNNGLNSDASAKTLAQGQYLNLQNGRWGVSEDGRNNRLESCRGTSLIAQTVLPSGSNLTLGSTTDEAAKRILYFNWNSNGDHCILCYDKSSGNSYKVLLNSQVTGGLNFSKSNRIDRNARVIAGMLYFTDGTENGQRKVNIDAGIKLNHPSYTTTVAAYTSPLNFSEITLIKPPPALAPTIQKDSDGSFLNVFIDKSSFSFAFQYVYRDNEISVVGAYSRASRLNNRGETFNRVIVTMDTGEHIPNTVSIVRLLVRVGNAAFVAKMWDKTIAAEATEIINHNSATTALTYNFYNNNTGEFIGQGDILKPYDSIPRSTKTIETAKDRLFLGNNLDGYNAPLSISFSTVLNNLSSITFTDAIDVFKSGGEYKIGVVFYDFAMRKCGVVSMPDSISIPPRSDYFLLGGVQSITASVNNANALAEIPTWAYYYSFVRTINLTTRFFVNSYDDAVKYVTKDADGEYVFTETTFVTGAVAIGIDTTALVQAGLGYTYSEDSGDTCILISDNFVFGSTYRWTLPVIGQSGKYILLKVTDIGTTTGFQYMYEIYTPYKQSLQEPFFETGGIFKVNNPTTNTRAYSTTSFTFLADSSFIHRDYKGTNWIYEAMSPNDANWRQWENDGGKVNLITKLGERNKTQSIYYSNTYIAGTAVNGLSTFEPLNQKSLPLEMGELTKLQAANKIEEQGQGGVMLAICAGSQTASLYLGEVQLSGASKTSDIIRTDDVIGSINVLAGTFGTTHPETVIEYGGLVFWVDTIKRSVVQYSSNGLDSVSKFDMVRFFERYIKDYESTSTSAIDTLNGFHHIPTALDPSFRKELLVVTPALVAESSMTDLPSYSGSISYSPSIKNRMDVYDKQGKAVGFSILSNQWKHTYSYVAEHFEYLGNDNFAFKNGQLYQMDADNVNWNTFFGVAAPMRLVCPINEIIGGDTELANVCVEANAAPTYTVAYSDNPNVQISDLVAADYLKTGTPYFAKFFRDRLSPISGTADEKLFTGDQITGYPISIMLEWNINNALVYIDAIDFGVNVSRGLTQIIQK